MISLADVIIIIAVFGFAFAGFFFGLIHTLGSVVGTIAGFIIASKYSAIVAGWLAGIFGPSGAVKVATFILIFLIASRLVGFIFWIVQKIFDVISLVPFLKSLNRLLGAALGVAEGIIVTGAALSYASTVIPEWILSLAGTSQFSGYLISAFNAVFGFIPSWVL